jgi:hypothetical protein
MFFFGSKQISDLWTDLNKTRQYKILRKVGSVIYQQRYGHFGDANGRFCDYAKLLNINDINSHNKIHLFFFSSSTKAVLSCVVLF